MINLPTRQELRELEGFNKSFCLTIYAPYIESNNETNPVQIEVKNLLREAETILSSADVSDRNIKRTLQPIKKHMEENELWPLRHESLLFFAHPTFFQTYHIPDLASSHLLTIETGFNLDILRQAMKTNEKYLVLALGHRNVQLYEGDRDHINSVSLKDFPLDMVHSLNIDEYPESSQTHPTGPVSLGKASRTPHEQYEVHQVDKTMLKEFFRRVDKKLHPYLSERTEPLILAGVDYIVALYRMINSHPFILKGAIIGNPEDTASQDIRKRAWTIAEEELKFHQ